MYERADCLSPQKVIEEYLSVTYDSYVELRYTDFTGLLDMSQSICRSIDTWFQYLIQRRRLLSEHVLCYVEQERFPYTVEFIEEAALSDERVSFWKGLYDYDENEVMVHFIVHGEKGKAYPPLLAVNSEHTIRLKHIDGEWYISFHYFPGSRRKFTTGSAKVDLPDDETLLTALYEEFAEPLQYADETSPVSALSYDGETAALYAAQYTEEKNPDFYDIGDWMGNCANFTSQCIWAGYSRSGEISGVMTDEWYAGDGGGSPAWENVGYFWHYAVEAGGLGGRELSNIREVLPGDLIQTSSLYNNRQVDPEEEDGERYNHSLIVVDPDTLLLAQNSPSCFVYYSDILNVETRLFRPGAHNSKSKK